MPPPWRGFTGAPAARRYHPRSPRVTHASAFDTARACSPSDDVATRVRDAAVNARARRETSAGGVVFRRAADGQGPPAALFLLIRDSYRNWGFPKGHLETGEVPEGAAVREVGEETGLVTLHVQGAIGPHGEGRAQR